MWFKQLIIWGSPQDEPRTIQFERGLNIIWSDRQAGGDRSLNTGNTSLARLLRYCMGEDHFGTAVHELRVQRKFPAGAVAAQLRLTNADWWVLRSLTNPSHRIAVRGEVLDDPWTKLQRSGDKGFSDFQKELKEVFTPKLQAHKPSEIALGFISRDHEGGFDNVFRWRAAHNNSGPSIREELRVWDLCALLGFRALKHSEAPAPTSAPKTSKLPETLALPDDLVPEVAETLGIVGEGAKSVHDLLVRAESKLASSNAALEVAKERLKELIELENLQAQLLQLTNHLQTVNNAREAKSRLKLRANARCQLAQKPLFKLLDDEGCLLKRVGCSLNTNDDVKKLSSEVKVLSADKEQIEHRLAQLKSKLGPAQAEEITALIADQKVRVQEREASFLKFHGVTQTLKNLGDGLRKDPISAEGQCAAAASSQKNQKVEINDEPSNNNFDEFIETYQRVVSRLISSAAAAALISKPNGIHDLLEESEELGSKESLMKLWAFDFATLVRSIEAPVSLPGLLIHDSPKQEDLAEEEYWRLFRLARSLEQGHQCNALFQYIVTTSTPPPNELRDDGHVRLHLTPGKNTKVNPETGEEEDDGYLFGCRFWTN